MAQAEGHDATSGRLIRGRYEVLSTLGFGGEGQVVKALDRQHHRVVALKIREIRDDRMREDLLNEARILLAIPPHPALSLVREDFFDGNSYVVAMDWVEGTDLAMLLRERGRPGLAPSSVLAYLAQASEALTHLHSQDPPVIHGDVKPANLILTKGGRVKLVDFGVSSALAAPRRAGTPGFRAPELAADGAPSRASDVYSLAATAFALLSGSPPLGVLPAWEGIEPTQAKQLEAALRRGLATDPARRPATPGELVEGLRTGLSAALPTGVITFCLSDIEGSTELWEADPAAMAQALVRHDEIIADHVEAHGGRFLKSMGEGDSTVSVFESAPQALGAAIVTTQALQEEPWPGGLRLAVRFGLHTGEAERRGADYFGSTVNLAARLRGRAGGGQIFASASTTRLVARHLPAGCELVDLGFHRLHGVRAPERLHALKGPGISAPLPASESPYRGLLAFEPDDRRFFFGRERVSAETIGRLASGRLLAIIGASGSGKSSVLRAGVAGAVEAGEVDGVERARIVTPGTEPQLAMANDPSELVIVDQFEELYTLCEDLERRNAFIDGLLALGCPAVIAVRADLYGRLGEHAELARAVADNQVLLGAMGDAELERAITEPARVAGLRLESGLVELILRDVAREPGALPLLSHALRVTWEQRDGPTLTVEGYRAGGGVASAIAQTADSVVDAVTPDRQALMRNLFLRLAELGERIEDTRRRVAVEELVPAGTSPDEVQALLDQLADARLVTLGEGTAEVAHEALIREWPRLRGWLEEDRAGIQLHRELGGAARRWEGGSREPGDLYRGTRLAAAVEWTQAHRDALNSGERAFLDSSLAESERESRDQLRANRRLRMLLAGVGLLLVAAMIAGVVALREGDRARDAALSADAQRLGAVAQVDERVERRLLLAQAGRELDDSVATRGYLLSVLVRDPAAIGVIQGEEAGIGALALSPDDRVLAAGSFDGTVTLFEAETREPSGRPLEVNRGVQALNFSPDGRLLAVSGPLGGAGTGGVTLLDVATNKTVREIKVGPHPLDPTVNLFVDSRFAEEGRTLVVTIGTNAPEGLPVYARRYDVRTGRPLGPADRVGPRDALPAPSIPADDDRLLFTGPRATTLVDAETLRVLRRIPVGAYGSALDPDGHAAALGYQDGSVEILDLRTGETRRLVGRHEDRVQGLEFTPDGRTLLTRSDDGHVLVWDLRSAKVRETLVGHTGAVPAFAVSGDGRTLYSAGLDGRIVVWDLAGDRRLARPFRAAPPFKGFPPPAPALAISPSGETVAAGLADGGVRLYDARTLERLRELPGIRDGFVTAVEFSPDGRTIAVTGEGASVEVRDVASGRRVRPPLPSLGARLHGPRSHPLSFSPDGGELAVADLDGNLRVLDLGSGEVRRVQLSEKNPLDLSFSPDGRLLAIALRGGAQVRDSRSLRVLTPGLGASQDDAAAVRFSPDGRLLAVGALEGGYTQLWGVADGRRVGPPLGGHEFEVSSTEFSPDGRTLATSGFDGNVRLWDVASQRLIGTLPGPFGPLSTRFTPDGRWLFTLHSNGVAHRWAVGSDAWSRHACRVAGRELTAAEWEEFVPDRDYQPVCS